MTRAFLAVRPYQEQFISIIALMLDSKLPCFRSDKVLEGLRLAACFVGITFGFNDVWCSARFFPGKSELEASRLIKERIQGSYLNIRAAIYDQIQYVQNGIAYK